ncbi:MAG: DUF6600 domain-containing protein [Candidatus Saccharicenans sp.]
MKKLIILIVIAIFISMMSWQPAQAGKKNYTLLNGEKDFYYGFISYLPEETGVKSPEVFRSGNSVPEPAQLNLPLVPGDLVVTYDKPCEIQFDSGTIVRLGVDSRLKIETIMAQTLSTGEQLSNLFLEKGTLYLMYTAYDSWEIFQLLTPNAALKMKNHTVVMSQVDENGETKIGILEGKGDLLFGPSSDHLQSLTIKKGESYKVEANNKAEKSPGFPELSDFLAWNEGLNKNFMELHKGITPLPKPIQKLPPAVFYFAQNYANKYGQWVWDDFYGYVWRPFYNDVYPWGNWSPYFYGRWSYVNGSLFWVPEEPWGWVPYHLGVWQWDKKLGWVWIPGSVFAPAWVDWEFYFGLYTWRPWMMMDWLFYDYYGMSPDYFWYYGGAGGGAYDLGSGQISGVNYLNKIRKDQLKKPQSSPIPVPGDYKSTLKNLSRAIEQKNPIIIERLTSEPPAPVAVKKGDLSSTHLSEKIIPSKEWLNKFSQEKITPVQKLPSTSNLAVEKLAAVDYLKNRTSVSTGQLPEKQAPGVIVVRGEKETSSVVSNNSIKVNNQANQPVPSSLPHMSLTYRFRDWNPDLKVARQLGIHVFYNSRQNSIISPELRLSSREAKEMRIRVTPYGIIQAVPSSSTSIIHDSNLNGNYNNFPVVEPKSLSGEKAAGSSSGSSGSNSSSARQKH